jgi:hypothetical protein
MYDLSFPDRWFPKFISSGTYFLKCNLLRDFLLGLLFTPKYGGDMFLRNVGWLSSDHPEDRTLQSYVSLYNTRTSQNIRPLTLILYGCHTMVQPPNLGGGRGRITMSKMIVGSKNLHKRARYKQPMIPEWARTKTGTLLSWEIRNNVLLQTSSNSCTEASYRVARQTERINIVAGRILCKMKIFRK